MLTTDKNTSHGLIQGRTIPVLIQNLSVIFRGAIAAFDVLDDGELVRMDSTVAGLRLAGVAVRGGTGDDADPQYAAIERRGTDWFPHSGTATALMIGSLAYAVDDAQVTDVPPSQSGNYDHVLGRIIAVDTSTNEVQVDYEDAANRDNESKALEVEKLVSGALAFGAFTDNGNTTGKIDTGINLPANSLLLGYELNVTAGFTGDTTAVADLGDGTTPGLYTGAQKSVLTVQKIGCAAAVAGAYVAAAKDLTLTVTGAADFTSISAGSVIVTALIVRL